MPEASRASEELNTRRAPVPFMATEAERESVRRPVMLTIADRSLIHSILHRTFDQEDPPLYAILHVIDALEASMCPDCSGTGVLSPPPGTDDLRTCGRCAGTGWSQPNGDPLDPMANGQLA
jgi:hypothetical protein